MKSLLTLLMLSSVICSGQKPKNLQISVQLQPELTYHQNQYSFRYRDKSTMSTFNAGFTTEVHYKLHRNFVMNVGLGFMSRRMNTKVFLNQHALPSPNRDTTDELNTTVYLAYRTLQVPLSIGYNFINKEKFTSFVIVGASANYLWNAHYKVGRPQYDDTYKKRYWQGMSLIGGIGTDISLSEKIAVVNSVSYSFVNTVRRDRFLFSQDEYEIPLPHKFLRLSAGIKIPL